MNTFCHIYFVSVYSIGLPSRSASECRSELGPAHVGHDLKVDQLAKEGTSSQNVFDIPKSRRCSKYDNHLKHVKMWADRWTEQPTCRQAQLMLP